MQRVKQEVAMFFWPVLIALFFAMLAIGAIAAAFARNKIKEPEASSSSSSGPPARAG